MLKAMNTVASFHELAFAMLLLGGLHRFMSSKINREGRYLNPANPLKNQGIYPETLSFILSQISSEVSLNM